MAAVSPSKRFPRPVLVGKLLWAPEESDDEATLALELCDHCSAAASGAGGGRGQQYAVCHYTPEALGRAFGPLGLGQLMRFCRGLEVALAGRCEAEGACRPLVLSTPPGNEEYRANAAVLLGAYLILSHSWSASRVAMCLGKPEASAKFACSWSRSNRPEEPRNMTVQDCWEGIELARSRDWIRCAFLKDDFVMEEEIRRYQSTLERYDTVWLIPGMLMVGADPITVQCDPNPATFTRIFPHDEEDGTVKVKVEAAEDCETRSNTSVETICKTYNDSGLTLSTEDGEGDNRTFVDFLRDAGVKLLVQANHDYEPGMPGPTWEVSDLQQYGIAQASLPFDDVRGGLPKPRDIARMLDACSGFTSDAESDTVLIHCKGGFGRSMIYACCLAISRMDIPGRALLGWSRIVRPGAVTNPLQEKFLKSMRGAKDVYRYAAVHPPEGVGAGIDTSCGCQVQ